jgi:hypothetical protein
MRELSRIGRLSLSSCRVDCLTPVFSSSFKQATKKRHQAPPFLMAFCFAATAAQMHKPAQLPAPAILGQAHVIRLLRRRLEPTFKSG